MKITVNRKMRNASFLESIFWGIFALLITGMTLLFTGIIILGTFLFVFSPIWLPIVLIIMLFRLI